jgi:hypothetical protein
MTALTLDPDGTWRHEGQDVRHKRLSALLHRCVARDDAGALIVTTGRDVLPFTPADAPKFVRALERTDAGWVVRLLGDTEAPLDASAEITIDDLGIVRSRLPGGFWARWSRSATQALLAGSADELDDDGALPVRLNGLQLRVTPTEARDWAG